MEGNGLHYDYGHASFLRDLKMASVFLLTAKKKHPYCSVAMRGTLQVFEAGVH